MGKKIPKGHKCDKEHVVWNDKPELGACVGDGIQWYGKCSVCGKSVFEIYNQDELLYEAASGEPVQ